MKNLCPLHNKEGFSLIEAVLAIAMFSIVAVSVLGLVNNALNYSFKSHSNVSRIFYIKGLFFTPGYLNDVQKDVKKVIEKKLEEPALNLKFSLEPLNKNLAKKFENCYLYKASGSWLQFGLEQENNIFGIGYIQKKEKEEKQTK